MVELTGPSVGPASEDVPETIRNFRLRIRQAKAHYSRWTTMADKYYNAYAGDPWDPADRAYMEGQDRPPVAFNYSLTTLNAILGQEMADRKEVQFKGHTTTDLLSQVCADWRTNLVRFWWQRSDGHRHESQAILDQLVTGYGWNQVYVDDSRFPFRVKPVHVDPWEVMADPKAKDDNLLDARWIIRERQYTYDEIKAQWPKKAEQVRESFSPMNSSQMFPKQAVSDYASQDLMDVDEETITVWEYQYKKKERYVAYRDPQDGQRKEMAIEEFKEVIEQIKMQQAMGQAPPEVDYIEFPRDVYYRCYLAGSLNTETIELEKPAKMPHDFFTYICITGFRAKQARRGRTMFFGMMHLVYEPQMWSAKVLSTIIEMMGRSSKGGGFVKKGALDHPDEFLEEIAKPGAWILVDGPLNDVILERKPANWPQGMDMLMHTAINAIPQVTAVTEFTKGTSTRERSNLLISNYQQQSEIVLTPIKDPITGFRIQLGRVLAKFIELYVAEDEINNLLKEPVEGLTHEMVPDEMTGDESLQPITDEMGIPITPARLLKQSNLNDYDTVIDVGQATSTEKQHLWQILTQTGLLQQLAELNMMPPDLIPEFMRLLPIQGDLAIKLGDKAESQNRQQEKMQTIEGITDLVSDMPPEQVMQLVQSLGPIIQETMAKQQQKQQQQQQPQQPQGPPQ